MYLFLDALSAKMDGKMDEALLFSNKIHRDRGAKEKTDRDQEEMYVTSLLFANG